MPSLPESLDALLDHLRRERVRMGASNVFLFGPEGDPFWAAWMPISKKELALLGIALDAIEATNAVRPRPFIGHDDENRFSFGALDPHELYFVLVMEGTDRDAAEARVSTFRTNFASWLDAAPSRRDILPLRH